MAGYDLKGVVFMGIKVLIADDDSLIRESLKIIIGMDEEFQVLGAVENGLEAVKYCREHKVDVALLDVRMPVMNGVEAIKEIASSTETKCLILTTFDEEDYIKDAIKFGAKGYILKNNSPDEIKSAIKMVCSGNSVMGDGVLEKVKKSLNDDTCCKIDKSKFTQREYEIMSLIAKGYSNREIASKIFMSEGTVKNYITQILSKTNLQHRTQIAIYFIQGDFSHEEK